MFSVTIGEFLPFHSCRGITARQKFGLGFLGAYQYELYPQRLKTG